jgi:hypothetical protein
VRATELIVPIHVFKPKTLASFRKSRLKPNDHPPLDATDDGKDVIAVVTTYASNNSSMQPQNRQ